MFKKILVANRGEIAVRIIRAAKEMGIKTVAVYSEADRDSPAVRIADQSVFLGDSQLHNSYLNYQKILSAALASNSEAIHPGYGLFAENGDFAEACCAVGLKFIGPSPNVIRTMGSKTKARDLMIKGGVKVVPGSKKAVNKNELTDYAKNIGFPLMLKASGGGGGKGIRVIEKEEELKNAFTLAVAEAEKNFGDPEIFIEKYLPEVKHIEVQIIADSYGNSRHLFERDCSLQRKHQKIIEEAPSYLTKNIVKKKLYEEALKVVKISKYDSVGTIEFLFNPHSEEFYFIEMNTRIQVEHPVTEEITGIDLIKEQISIAAGYPFSFKQDDIKIGCHALECRINAENPQNNFSPSPGIINEYKMPGGFGVRIDSGIDTGTNVPPFYDSLLCKIITKAETREQALKKMICSLQECEINGVSTNIKFLLNLLSTETFKNGKYTTSTIEKIISGEKNEF